MIQLHWELSVLSRAVAYGNLSGAVPHVGLSQPQLSRIVAKVEKELGLALLDRSARRKSAWTPAAYRLAEVYSSANRRLEGEIHKLVKVAEPSHLKIGTLEGLIPLALKISHHILKSSSVRLLELSVHDLNALEELFLAGELDLIFTAREPGRKKHKFRSVLGYQSLEHINSDSGAQVMSLFEYGSAKGLDVGKIIVSNSLEVRKNWLLEYGGTGIVPSDVQPKKTSADQHAVILLGSDQFSPALWEKIK